MSLFYSNPSGERAIFSILYKLVDPETRPNCLRFCLFLCQNFGIFSTYIGVFCCRLFFADIGFFWYYLKVLNIGQESLEYLYDIVKIKAPVELEFLLQNIGTLFC